MSKSDSDTSVNTLPDEVVMSRIYIFRDQKVMLDSDLAELYGVETKQLKRQVRRNTDRFPSDFMFELTKEELEILRSQIGTLRHGEHTKYLPMVFSEHGVLMLSSVLNSKQASSVNTSFLIYPYIVLSGYPVSPGHILIISKDANGKSLLGRFFLLKKKEKSQIVITKLNKVARICFSLVLILVVSVHVLFTYYIPRFLID